MSRVPFDPIKPPAARGVQSRTKEASASLLSELLDQPNPSAPAEPNPPPLAQEATNGGSMARPWSVSQLNACLNQLLARSLPPAFFIAGEISNFRTYDRGHAFFTLKDPSSEIPCIFWKDDLARLKFRPKDGLSVIARGEVRLYEPQGKVQLYVDTLYPQGAGALELAFRQLCEKLRAQGLFETSRKRPIPRLPRHVAIITSRTGDVLHDVVTTAHRRFPGLHLSLFPVRVQGAQAAQDIVHAIKLLNTYVPSVPQSLSPSVPSPPDLILLVRGGGSLEDLWAFNEESVAGAIVASRIPIATGIGHEPDTTIADLVGDLRGPTPTGITELTIPDARALSTELLTQSQILTRDIRRLLTQRQTGLTNTSRMLDHSTKNALRDRRFHLDQLTRKIASIEPRHAIAQGWRRVEEAQRSLARVIRDRTRRRAQSLIQIENRLQRSSPTVRIDRARDRIEHLRDRLQSVITTRLSKATQHTASLADQLRTVSPQAVLDRGFSITQNANGDIIRSATQVQRGDQLNTKVADGTIQSTVGKLKQSTLF